jgi:hypothetical protein
LVAAGIGLSGCAAPRLGALKNLPIDGAVYVPGFLQFDHFPDWMSLYSVLPGNEAATCPTSESFRAVLVARTISVTDCSGATTSQRSEFAAIMARVLDATEQRLEPMLRVVHASYTLIPPGHAYVMRDTRRIRAARLRIDIAVRYHPQDMAWTLSAARATAHESYHIAMVASDSEQTGSLNLPEETRASLFAACVERDVFGRLESGILENRSEVVSSSTALTIVRQSEAGKQMASEMLRVIVGSDGDISPGKEHTEFEELCSSLVE